VKYVFDASAIIKVVELRPTNAVKVLSDQYTADLAYYEIGNFVWKLYRRSIITDAKTYIELFTELLSRMRIEEVGLRTDVLEVAIGHGLTYYDAAYLWLAKQLDATLVTEDKELCRAYTPCISATQLAETKD